MTREEISTLLQVCAPHRRLMLETSFLSGLRANELRNLSIDHLDVDRCGLHLDANWTKNRKAGFQPVPKDLVDRLHTFAQSDEVKSLYSRFYARRDAKLNAPANPLLYVPSHTARDLDIDLKAAGIPKNAPGGKLDFHACRLAYINFIIETGASVKEAQSLARHSTPELTMNVYGRVREDRLSQTVEDMAQSLVSEPERAIYVQKLAVGAEQESATPFANRELRLSDNGGGGGNRTRRSKKCRYHTYTVSRHKTTTKQHINDTTNIDRFTKSHTLYTGQQHASTAEVCTRCVPKYSRRSGEGGVCLGRTL